MASTKKINLKSRDGDVFEIEEAVALKSQTIKHMIEDNCADDTGIPLPNVTSQILAKVIEYCKKHVEAENAENSEEKPADDDGHVANSEKKPSEDDGLKAWDTEFVKVDQVTLFELLLAANYLDIKSLQELACKTIADIMVGKTVEEIRKMFNIVNDYTKEEEEEVRREHQWAFE